MKIIFKSLLFVVKWALLLVLCVELLCFAIVSASNYIIYGHIREGSRVVYDPFTMFRSVWGLQPTTSCTAPPGSKEVTIWVFGGSTTRGQTNDPDTTVPSYLSQILGRQNPGVCYNVVNFGENSYNSLLEVKYFQKQLITRNDTPDLVIFYDGANDSVYFAQHRSPDGHHGYRRARALIESYHKNFFGVFKSLNAAIQASFTKELHDKLMQVQVPIEPDSPELREHVELVGRRYSFANKVASCYGAHFLVFWQPTQWVEQGEVVVEVSEKEKRHFVNTDRFSNMRENFTTVYESLLEDLKARPYFVNFRNVLVPRKEVAYQPDGVHLTAYGREFIAKAMAETLRSRGIL